MITKSDVNVASPRMEEPAENYAQDTGDKVMTDDKTLGDALLKLNDVLFITDHTSGKLKGILTSNDINAARQRGLTTAANVMDAAVHKVLALQPNQKAGDAVRTFAGNNPLQKPVDYIPLIDADGKPVKYLQADTFLQDITAPPAPVASPAQPVVGQQPPLDQPVLTETAPENLGFVDKTLRSLGLK